MRCLWGPLLPLFSLRFAASQLLNCRSVSQPDPRLWCHLATPNYPTFLPSGLWVISLRRSGHTEYPELEGAHKNNRPAANRPQRAQSGLRQRCYSPGYLGGTNKRALGFISVRPLSFSPAKTTKRDTQLCVPSRFRNLSRSCWLLSSSCSTVGGRGGGGRTKLFSFLA